jgi:hypothetical protein
MRTGRPPRDPAPATARTATYLTRRRSRSDVRRPHPTAQVAEAPEDLRVTGSDPTGEVPVDAALLRGGRHGRGLRPIGGERAGPAGRPLDDGVAALLRYPVPTGA